METIITAADLRALEEAIGNGAKASLHIQDSRMVRVVVQCDPLPSDPERAPLSIANVVYSSGASMEAQLKRLAWDMAEWRLKRAYQILEENQR